MKKTVTFYSFGHHHLKQYPKKPADGTCQLIFDLRMLYEPFHDGYQESGLEKNIRQLVLRENRPFFTAIKPIIRNYVESFFGDQKYSNLNIYFGCVGGWQRSVAAAEYFKD